ncbi:DUF4157 domain-containing protein [Streptomyces sp. ITFR-6]|uniref:eCIS core domain-containing protein n=1 Tax=Streptomyces sp. ITFR-6 TaxID=3075197 RepID=UPI002889BC70|nr:DUF4157 domain-containing protein [Streptomyces sp. ITFR-6]WNI29918.1 DUF4157 domain-containing protein [Streptomyces sp. ITFR-6]
MRLQDQQDTAARRARTAPAGAQTADTAGRALSAGPVGLAGPAAGPAALELLALQRTAGNAAAVEALQRRQAEGHGHGASCGHDDFAPVQRSSVPDVLRAAGRPLDGPVRTEMEARLGADFSDVRLHTGPSAQRSAAEVGARAYTSGSHVVIGAGGADRHTLAHELTHVIQQRQGPVAGTDNGSGLRVSDPSDRFERAAEENARRVLSRPAPTGAAPVQRTAAAPSRTGGEIAVQRSGDGEAPFDHAQYYANTGWQASAEEFEKRLGAYSFGHPRALAAARKTVNRLKQLLINYARTEHKDTALANKSFFKDDKTSAGQVGDKMTTARRPAATRTGAPRSAGANWTSSASPARTTSCPGTRAPPTGRSSRTRPGRRRTPSAASRSSRACPGPRPGCSRPSSGSTCPGWTSSTTGWP